MLCKHSAFPCGEARCRWSRRCCANTVRFYAAKRGLGAEEDAVQAQDVSVRRSTLWLVERMLCKYRLSCARKRGSRPKKLCKHSTSLRDEARACGRRRDCALSLVEKMLCEHSTFLCGEAQARG